LFLGWSGRISSSASKMSLPVSTASVSNLTASREVLVGRATRGGHQPNLCPPRTARRHSERPFRIGADTPTTTENRLICRGLARRRGKPGLFQIGSMRR
jgi:hypothetical protein